jgi:hypothetical protein
MVIEQEEYSCGCKREKIEVGHAESRSDCDEVDGHEAQLFISTFQ